MGHSPKRPTLFLPHPWHWKHGHGWIVWEKQGAGKRGRGSHQPGHRTQQRVTVSTNHFVDPTKRTIQNTQKIHHLWTFPPTSPASYTQCSAHLLYYPAGVLHVSPQMRYENFCRVCTRTFRELASLCWTRRRHTALKSTGKYPREIRIGSQHLAWFCRIEVRLTILQLSP